MHPLFLWLSHLQSLSLSVRAPIAVSLGAIAGALSRYYLTLGLTQWLGPAFPYATFTINLSGSFVMGFFATLVLEQVITSPELRLLISVGFLGSYTTFSTYALDTVSLLDTGRESALFYWAGSAFLGVVSLELGRFLARGLL